MARRERILIVGGLLGRPETLRGMLEREGYEVLGVPSRDAARRALDQLAPDTVIAGTHATGDAGFGLLAELRQAHPDLPVLLVAAPGTPDAAVEALYAGAVDYLTGPLDPGRLVRALRRASEARYSAAPLGSREVLAESTLRDGLRGCLTLRELSDLYIERVLELTGGNKVRAAKALGINRRTLYRRGRQRGGGESHRNRAGSA